MIRRPLLAAVCLCTPLALSALVSAHVTDQSPPAAQNQAGSLSPQTRQRLTESLNKAAAYLRQQRKPDGKWEDHPGITGLAALALMNMPGVDLAAIRTELKPSLDWIA